MRFCKDKENLPTVHDRILRCRPWSPSPATTLLLLLVLLIVALNRLWAFSVQDSTQLFRSEAIGVVVDAVVRDAHGRFLRCLSKRDFRVTEDGKEQQIEGFEFVAAAACGSATSTSGEEKSVAEEVITSSPVTAIVFEELGPEARAAAFRSAQVFVRERMLETEFVGVFTLDFAIHTIVPYTRDRAAALEGIRQAAMRPGCPQRVNGLITGADEAVSCAGEIGEAKVKATLAGLQAVVRTLSALPGRKNVLLFSQGFTISTAESANDRLEQLIAVGNQRGVTFQAIDAVGLRAVDGRQATRQRLSSYTGGANGAGGLVTTKEDPNALLGMDPTATLDRLADGTGGEFVHDTNDLENAIRQLAGEMHEYYRLSYRPSDQSSTRREHRIAINVSLPGAVVRTRTAYYTGPERDREAHVLGPAEVSPHLILDSGSTFYDFEMKTALNGTGRNVEVRASVPAAGLTFRSDAGRFGAAVTVLARAIGRDKNVIASASDSFTLSGPTEGLPAARDRTIQFAKTLTVKNAATIEVIAYDVLGRRASVERHDVSRPER
jgi:VWFA-related protein